MELRVSIGLVLGKANFQATELISRADAVCRIAKIPGNAKVSVYEESDPDLVELRRHEHWAAKIPNMIIDSNFCLFGQKIIPLYSDNTTGHIEILLRGLNQQGEIIPTELFLPAAERFGLMPKIDRWVIETLLSYNLDKDLHFSINLSAHTLADKAYIPELIALISASGKPDNSFSKLPNQRR
ncbi:MAG: EAL domain-containing protein [Oceanospirillaceae bacterium]|nr:EAL domain-containing protein [Oceanospirillaceae bacterium]